MIRLDIDREYLSTLCDITLWDMKMASEVRERGKLDQTEV
jgi:hypothetical protein